MYYLNKKVKTYDIIQINYKKVMNIYLVRHGQTEANVNKLFNGRNEGNLTQFGIEQAKSLLDIIKNLNIDIIFSSPLKRAIQTAEILNLNNKELIIDERLIERDFKNYTLKSVELIEDKSIIYKKECENDIDIEPFSKICERVGNFISDIKLKYNEKNILIVSHGDIILAFKMYFEKGTTNIQQPKHCEIIKYKI